MSKSLLGVAILFASSSAAQAAIVSTSGTCTQIAPPPVANFPAINAPFAQVWDEQQSVLVGAGVFANLTTNPSSNGAPVPGFVTPGLDNSHFIHWSTLPPAFANGTVTFDGQIRAVFYGDNELDLTDATLGALGTVYPTGQAGRGINAAAIVSVNGTKLTFLLSGNGNIEVEQLRVLTDVVPAPGAVSALSVLGLMVRRRRNN